MTDDAYRQRKKINPDDLGVSDQSESSPLESIQEVQKAIAKETGREMSSPMMANPDKPFEIGGPMPPEFREALERRRQASAEDDLPLPNFPPRRKKQMTATSESKPRVQGSDELEGLLQRLAEKHQWETFTFPSKGVFYQNIPDTIHIRAMTGEEEQILATPRFVRKGRAIDMIFDRCIRERINTEELLSVDRTHLLIYLRGISYTPEYDVEIKCPNCTSKFSHVIDLDSLDVDRCPDDFGPDDLEGVLPESGFTYRYRLATGGDERAITDYRDKRIQMFGDQSEDDTLLYRTAILLENVEGVTDAKELAMLLKKLPINDVAHLRNEINEPPFGVKTGVEILCPSCSDDFKIDLPLETNFFFPRKKETKTRA